MNVIHFADVFEASLYEFACFFGRCGNFGDVVVVLEVDELCVHQGVIDVLVSEDSHDMKDVFGFVVFNGGFEMSESVEADVSDPRVAEFFSDFLALSLEDASLIPNALWKYPFGFRVPWRSRSIALSLLESWNMRGLLPFSGVMRTVLFSKSMSVRLIALASPMRIPVSFKS